MLKGKCINPPIMSALSRCGHGDKVLIADGNYPINTMTKDAEIVYLALTPGEPNVTTVLNAILDTVNVEKAEVMCPDDGHIPEIFEELRNRLGLELSKLSRYSFYDACMEQSVRLAILTGELRTYSNILLTVGCV